MRELWLVRHAESVGNRDGSGSDSELTPEGREQALALVPALIAVRFDRVLCSPLLRARQTAAIALPDANLEIEPRLRELVVPGERFVDVAGLGPERLRALLNETSSEPAAETGKAFMTRVREWLAELPEQGKVLAFTHFAVIREALRACTPGPVPQTIAPASITIVRREP
ncbi:histidine phosphatase family protein [Nannocystaceae bacterium ST9]